MDGETVSLRPDLCGGDVCGVDGAPERVPLGESAVPHVLGSDDGRIRGGYLSVQYRVRGLAETPAASDEPSTSAGLAIAAGGSGAGQSPAALAQSIRDLELDEEEEVSEEEGEEVDDSSDIEVLSRVDKEEGVEEKDIVQGKKYHPEEWKRDYDNVD